MKLIKQLCMTILYADDDFDDQAFVLEAFRDIDPSIYCLTVCDGREAIDLLNKIEPLPDFIFLDINMPVMGGRECLVELKKSERFKEIPVVVLSTTSDPLEIKFYYELGALSFMHKPDSLKKLYTTLNMFLNMVGNKNNSLENQNQD